MAKAKPLNLPDTPTYQQDPVFQQGYKSLLDWGQNLSSGNFGWLSPLLDNSQNALKQAQGVLQPQFRDTLTQIKNEAAANGQLESSTFTDALARSQSDLNSQYQSIVSGQAIADNQNKLGLFGQGLGAIGQATTFGQQNQDSQNRFNLDNYSNQVAQAIQQNQNANKANWWQQIGGFVSPVYHDYLQSQGINSVPGYGTQDIAKLAAPFVGALTGNPLAMAGGLGSGTTSAGMSASNNPYGLTGNNYGQLYSRN